MNDVRLVLDDDRLLEMVLEQRERRRIRDANRAYAALMLSSSLVAAQALYRGRPVPREALAPEFQSRLVCWDGVLTDDLVLDTLVLLEADRQAGNLPEPEPLSAWLRQPGRQKAA
jgi:hypothetical protein